MTINLIELIHFKQNVNISPHHAESVQPAPVAYQSATHKYPSQTSNVTSSTTPNQIGQQQVSQPPPPPSRQQQTQQTQTILQPPPTNTTSTATNLTHSLQNLSLADGNNVAYVNNDGIPVMRKSQSGSASSIESIDDSTPPDTPHTTDATNSSGISSSSSFKKQRVRNDSKSSTSSSEFTFVICVVGCILVE